MTTREAVNRLAPRYSQTSENFYKLLSDQREMNNDEFVKLAW